jgi:hypothetical protein
MLPFFKAFHTISMTFSYGPGKWTIKEAILHVTDTERVYGYRSLVAGRMDGQTDLTPI